MTAPARDRLALIRSIVNHATDPERALQEVAEVLAGWSIEEILAMRSEG